MGGWKKLSAEDYADLAQRVDESREEIKKENEELDPDELVPVSFKGEMRPSPPGLDAVLLPFQVEGVSWMYHQEIIGESGVRGGMLCDEVRYFVIFPSLFMYSFLTGEKLSLDGNGKDNSDDHCNSR